MGLGWGWGWGAEGGPCPVSNPMVGATTLPARLPANPPPSPQQAAAAVLRGGGSGEAATAARPLLLGPSLDSGEGKETRQGEARSNTNQQPCLCLRLILKRRMLNLKRADSVCVCACGRGRRESGGRSREEAACETSRTSLQEDEVVVASTGSRQENTAAPRTFTASRGELPQCANIGVTRRHHATAAR